MANQDESVVLPMWRGRRGLLNTLFAGALGALAAAAFWHVAVAAVVRPACSTYAATRGLRYVDYKVYSKQIRSSGACVLSGKGGTEDVLLVDATSILTDTWVGVAFSPEITFPAFTVLFAFAWTWLMSGRRTSSPSPPKPWAG